MDDLVSGAKSAVRQKVPSWAGVDGPDAGTALVEACAGMVAPLIERVNRAADKDRLAVLAEVGAQPRPASPARTQVEFSMTVALPRPVEIPAGTQVVADVPGGGEAAFATTQDALLYSCTLLNSGVYKGAQYRSDDRTFTGMLGAFGASVELTQADVLLAVLSNPVPDTRVSVQVQVGTAPSYGPPLRRRCRTDHQWHWSTSTDAAYPHHPAAALIQTVIHAHSLVRHSGRHASSNGHDHDRAVCILGS
uniref:hypothetical protein n=1 Tax=Kitasatospora sp. NBC_01519 TaxID=2903576 RepID=UPI002F91359D